MTPGDTDDAIIAKITASLNTTNTALKPGKIFPDSHPWRFLVGGANTAPNLVESLLANSDIKAALIEALRWKSLDSEAKYARAFEVTLDTPKSLSKLIIPEKKDTYEIAYLGGQGDARNFVFGFSPESKTALPEWFTKIQSLQDSYNPDSTSIDLGGDSEFILSPAEIA